MNGIEPFSIAHSFIIHAFVLLAMTLEIGRDGLELRVDESELNIEYNTEEEAFVIGLSADLVDELATNGEVELSQDMGDMYLIPQWEGRFIIREL